MNRNSQLLALNEDKNNLIRILAHDLRSPVNNIIGLANILETSKKDISNANKQLVTHISDGANQLNQMITKILNPESLNGDSKLIIKEEVDVRQIMNDISARYRPIASKKNIQLALAYCNEDIKIKTDHLLLFLVLENLVSNAVKFSPSQTTVTLKSEHIDQDVIFTIADQGPGFSDTDKGLMFNRFQKLSAQPTANELSTGLGLSIVKKYVGDLGAKVWLESEKGHGSIFRVSIPIK
ncbi:MAG: HAMP domain-containing histidine kinase [Cyclobacteriaceae bacterium]